MATNTDVYFNKGGWNNYLENNIVCKIFLTVFLQNITLIFYLKFTTKLRSDLGLKHL